MAPSKSKAASSHPTYLEMIKDAILSLKERTGSSQYAIAKFIENKHRNQLPPNFKKLLLLQLKKIVASDKLVKVKNSYKLPPTRVAAAAKPVAAVAAKKPSVKSSAAPVASKPKAPAKPKSKAETTKPKAAGARSKLAAKPKTASKPKAKPVAKVARTSMRSSPGKKASVQNMKKSPAKSVKKPKSVKSPAKKAPARKANK